MTTKSLLVTACLIGLVSILSLGSGLSSQVMASAPLAQAGLNEASDDQPLSPPDPDEEDEEEKELEALQAAIKEKGAKWRAGKTSVSRLSLEEKKRLCGLKFAAKEFQAAGEKEETEPVGLLASFDWRNKDGDWTTPIRNQAACGSCWAFGSLAALEAQIDIAANDPTIDIDLAEQYMLSCSDGSCEGWSIPATMDFLRDTGTTDEACFAYEADDTIPCSDACPYCAARNWRIASWGWLSPVIPPINTVKSYLQDRPLVTGFDVYADFYYYTGGVYEHVWGGYKGGHMVAIVGWDDANECWICKNSWGTDWGEDGWFRIRWGECYIEYWSLHSEFVLTKRVISCDSGGTERDLFAPGEDVYVKALGLSQNTGYKIWIQSNPVAEDDALDEVDPSGSQESVTTDENGNLWPGTLIWPIDENEPITYDEYDIVIDKQEGAGIGTYNAAADAIDSATVAGILAPIPEASTLVLLMTGILCLFGILYLRRRRERQI